MPAAHQRQDGGNKGMGRRRKSMPARCLFPRMNGMSLAGWRHPVTSHSGHPEQEERHQFAAAENRKVFGKGFYSF